MDIGEIMYGEILTTSGVIFTAGVLVGCLFSNLVFIWVHCNRHRYWHKPGDFPRRLTLFKK
jgi:hypothetical protein